MRVLVLAVRVSKTLEFQSFFQRVQSAWNSSSFILVLESPWLLIEEHFQTSKTLWQIPVWRQQNKIGIEEMKVCRTHKRIFIKIAALIWKRCVTHRLGHRWCEKSLIFMGEVYQPCPSFLSFYLSTTLPHSLLPKIKQILWQRSLLGP